MDGTGKQSSVYICTDTMFFNRFIPLSYNRSMSLGRGVHSIDNFWKGLWLPTYNIAKKKLVQFHVQNSSLLWLSVWTHSWFSRRYVRQVWWKLQYMVASESPLIPKSYQIPQCNMFPVANLPGPRASARHKGGKKKKNKREGKTFHFLHKRSQIIIATNFFHQFLLFPKDTLFPSSLG